MYLQLISETKSPPASSGVGVGRQRNYFEIQGGSSRETIFPKLSEGRKILNLSQLWPSTWRKGKTQFVPFLPYQLGKGNTKLQSHPVVLFSGMEFGRWGLRSISEVHSLEVQAHLMIELVEKRKKVQFSVCVWHPSCSDTLYAKISLGLFISAV